MIDRAGVLGLLEAWVPDGDGEAEKSRELVARMVAESAAPFSREQFTPGHLTASACVLDPAGGAVLLIHHGKLRRWLLPGGHVEAEIDADALAAARREAIEETGVRLDEAWTPRLAGIDVHGIPARKAEPFHLHHDLIVAFRAASLELTGSEEIGEALWCPVAELDRYAVPGPIRRSVARAIR